LFFVSMLIFTSCSKISWNEELPAIQERSSIELTSDESNSVELPSSTHPGNRHGSASDSDITDDEDDGITDDEDEDDSDSKSNKKH